MTVRTPSLRLASLIALALAAFTFATPAMAQEGIKIAVVDLDYIVTQSPAGKALQQELMAFQEAVKSELDAKASAAQAIQQRMADGANSLSADKLAELQKELEDATIAMRRLRDDKQREGEKKQSEGLQRIEAELEPVFNAVRDEGGYDIILNNVAGVVVMTSERVNITQQVLDRLNAGGN